MTIQVLDPRLDPEREPLVRAPALATLAGATIALLDNAKIGTATVYDHLETLLRGRGVREVLRRRKPDTSRPVPAGMLAELAAADALVSGIGD